MAPAFQCSLFSTLQFLAMTVSGSWPKSTGIRDIAAERKDAPSRDNVIKSSLWDSNAPGSFPLSRISFVFTIISCVRDFSWSLVFSTFSRRRNRILIFFCLVLPRICGREKRLLWFVRFLEDLRRISLTPLNRPPVGLVLLVKYILTRLFQRP